MNHGEALHREGVEPHKRPFPFDEFKRFLQRTFKVKPEWTDRHGARLFSLTDKQEVIDFLTTYMFGGNYDNATIAAELILREEKALQVQGLHERLKLDFVAAHLDHLLGAKTPEEISDILQQHVPSLGEHDLLKATEAIALHLGLDRTKLRPVRAMTPVKLPESAHLMSEEELGIRQDDVFSAMEKLYPPQPDDDFSAMSDEGRRILGEAAVERASGGHIDSFLARVASEDGADQKGRGKTAKRSPSVGQSKK